MASRRRVAKSATEGLKILWEERFFRAWRKRDAVVAEFAKRDNHFPEAELGMALLRAGHLTRKGKRGSYQYIKKYPFVEDEAEASTPKKGGKK